MRSMIAFFAVTAITLFALSSDAGVRRAVSPVAPPPSISKGPPVLPRRLTHLKQLEAESIHVLREVVAEFQKPVMLYSIGKDSSVMAHLALKAFAPAKPPFPLLHIDTTWKFREMIAFRDRFSAE